MAAANFFSTAGLVILYLIQNSPAVKKGAAPKRPLWKKMWNPRWWPRNGCDGRLMAKFLTKTIQVNLCCLLPVSLGIGTKFTWIVSIVVIKNFAISLPSLPFLGHHLGFHIFFHNDGCTFFTVGLFWIILFVIAYCVARRLNIFFYLWFFLSVGTKSIFTG